MHVLVLDYGNSLKKIAVFEADKLLLCYKTPHSAIPIIKDIYHKFPLLKHAIIGSVSHIEEGELEMLKQSFQLLVFTHTTPLPFINQYQTPRTLGLDRLANVAGGLARFPKQNMLIIDIGSCITYDIIKASGTYLGGAITPGLRLRAMAMHQFTDKLPMVEHNVPTSVLGTSTTSCMQSGIFNGTRAEIDGMIDVYKADFKDLKIILSGGDALYFEKRLKNNIFAAPNLVLEGLHNILKYNEFES